MTRKNTLIIAALVLLSFAAWYIAWNKEQRIPSDRITNFDECASAGFPVMESYPRQCAVPDGQTFTEDTGQVVGGDADEHGCIGSAGYSWCEPKQKCLRIWEEDCYADLEQELQYSLAAKYEKSPNDVFVTITKQSAAHAAGGIKFSEDPNSPGGLFLAAKIDQIWHIVYDGNGSIDCERMRTEYAFPDAILVPNFCD